MQQKTSRPTAAFLGVVLFAFALYYVMVKVQVLFLDGNSVLPDYNTWEHAAACGDIMHRIMWALGDMTEPHFYKSWLASLGFLAGAILAHSLWKRKSRYMGFPLCGRTGLWPWVYLASLLSLVLSNLLFINNLDNGWFPTFVPFVCVAGATVLQHGRGWRTILTGVVMGCLTTVPVSALVVTYITGPCKLPTVIGSVTGMWAGGIVCFEIYRLLPWMNPAEQEQMEPLPADVFHRATRPNRFFLRRLLADFGEPFFCGNEYVGVLLLVGVIAAWVMNPFHVTYSTGVFPAVLFSQLVSVALSIYLYFDQWLVNDWFPTFPTLVSTAPGVTMLWGGDLRVAVIAAVFGGIVCPALAWQMEQRMPAHWPGFIAATGSMTVSTVLCGGLVLFLRPVLGL